MTTGATGQLGLALPVQGELSGTWGDTVNNGITQYTNIAIAGTLTLTNDGAVTLANTTGDASASNITSSLTGAGTVTAQFAIVKVTGTLTTAKVVTGPSYSKTYTVVNSATGGIVTFKASGQTGVSIAVGETAFVYYNGTDYVKVVGTATAGAAGGSNTQVQFNSSGVLAGDADLTFDGTTLSTAGLTASGTVTLSGGTANGVAYLNGSKVVTSGGALTFDGTNLSVGGGTAVASTSGGGVTAGLFATRAALTAHQTATGVFQYTSNEAAIRVYGSSGVTGQLAFNLGAGGSADSEQMRLTSTGLGIGTSSPQAKLHVAGNAYISEGNSIAGYSVPYSGVTSRITMSAYTGTESTLQFSTMNSSGIVGERMRIDGAGNLGLGVTPSAWAGKSFQIGNASNSGWASIGYDANGKGFFATSAYNNTGSSWTYTATGFAATLYSADSGAHKWYTAPSGTAGNAITFTQAMTLDASGRLAIGTTSIDEMVRINGSSNATARIRIQNQTTDIAFLGSALGISGSGNANDLMLSSASTNNLVFGTNTVERARITSDGTVLFRGGSVPTADAYDAPFIFRIGGGGLGLGAANETGNLSPISFYTQGTEKARINSSGQVLIGSTSTGGTKLGVADGASDASSYGSVQVVKPLDHDNKWHYALVQNGNDIGGIGFVDNLSGSFVIGRGSDPSTTNSIVFDTSSNTKFNTNGSERARFTSGGQFLVGTTTTSGGEIARFQTASGATSIGIIASTTGSSYVNFGDTSDANVGFIGYDHTNNYMNFRTNSAEAMRIDSSGRMLVGASSFTALGTFNAYSAATVPAGRFVGGPSLADGSIALMVDKYSTTNTTSQWFLGFTINNTTVASGVITANGASQAAFGAWSDRRLKENIVDLPPQLANIMALRPVEFDYIASEGGGHQISFIAQEFEQVYPDAVGERQDGMKTLTGWAKTEARLVKAIQEQQAIIESLKARLDAANL